MIWLLGIAAVVAFSGHMNGIKNRGLPPLSSRNRMTEWEIVAAWAFSWPAALALALGPGIPVALAIGIGKLYARTFHSVERSTLAVQERKDGPLKIKNAAPRATNRHELHTHEEGLEFYR